MNKYEEALRELYYQFRRYPKDKNIEFLIELVKRATPMKPINVERDFAGLIGKCPQCNWWCDSFSLNDGINYCQVCGQALLWE